MSDGCWVQFWDDTNCSGATLRFDAESGTLLVADLDDYQQSDGSKEGDEPDSLVTGSRAWLAVYKDDDFKGGAAMFPPNTRVDDLDVYGFDGNISSFKLYDSRPSWFNDTTTGNPVAYESNDGTVDAATVNNVFRTVVGAALTLIPGIGSGLSILVRGLWPDVDNKDQVWGSFQNYLNQSIAGVYWQLSYELLNDTLESLFKAAEDFIEISDEAHQAKANAFENLYNEVNNNESYFVDKDAPEKRFSFLVPFATLRLATLQENLRNYAYYYGSEPSQEEVDRLTTEINESIELYQNLLSDARDRILARRDQMIFVDDGYLLDLYFGRRMGMYETDTLDSRRYYAENVRNELALRLDQHIAVSQLWPYFKPDATGPVQPPVLDYVTGPMGYFWYGIPDFSQVAEDGKITRVDLWTYSGGPNPAEQNGLELYIDGSGRGRAGGEGGTLTTLGLASDEVIVDINGTVDLRYLRFVSDRGNEVAAGDPNRSGGDFRFVPLPDTLNARLVGVSGSAGGSGNAGSFDSVHAIAAHWRCELPIDGEGLPQPARAERVRVHAIATGDAVEAAPVG
jgi:hypothetical protein